jgi:hypothetical protein
MAKPVRAGAIVEREHPVHAKRPVDERAVIQLRVPSLDDRMSYETAVSARSGGPVFPWDLQAAQDAAIGSIPDIADADRELFRQMLTDLREAERALIDLPDDAGPEAIAAAEPSRALRASVRRLDRTLRQVDPLYVELLEQELLHSRLASVMAAKMLLVGGRNLVGADGKPVTVALDATGCRDEVLKRFSQPDLRWIGQRAAELFYISETDAKNFGSPSGGSGGGTSSSDPTPGAAGPSETPTETLH